MAYLVIILFVLGYAAIAFERKLSIDRSAIALVTGTLVWLCIALGSDTIYPVLPSFQDYLLTHPNANVMQFVSQNELIKHLGKISEIIFFLLGTMAIIEIIDSHGCFNVLSKLIKTNDKIKLLWIFSLLSFFMSAVLGNIATTVIMITLMWKMVSGENTRWYFASMILIAANAGGVWSPIGNVTTIMLWIGENVSTLNIVFQLIVPCLISMLVPLVFISLNMRGVTTPISHPARTLSMVPTTDRERWIILITGIGGLLFVPVFRAVTHLQPYVGVLLVLGIMWIMTEIMHRKKENELKMRLTLAGIIKKVNTPTLFFFLGILLAVAGLESAGYLKFAGVFFSENVRSILAINTLVGLLSSVVDNVPLVATVMGMFDIVSTEAQAAVSDPVKAAYMKLFMRDGTFWGLLTYCSGIGASIFLIGSTAGIAAMRLAKIEFKWFVKKISWLVFVGYLLGATAYYLMLR